MNKDTDNKVIENHIDEAFAEGNEEEVVQPYRMPIVAGTWQTSEDKDSMSFFTNNILN